MICCVWQQLTNKQCGKKSMLFKPKRQRKKDDLKPIFFSRSDDITSFSVQRKKSEFSIVLRPLEQNMERKWRMRKMDRKLTSLYHRTHFIMIQRSENTIKYLIFTIYHIKIYSNGFPSHWLRYVFSSFFVVVVAVVVVSSFSITILSHEMENYSANTGNECVKKTKQTKLNWMI